MLQKTCSITGLPFFISEQEIAFCTEHDIPLPTISPLERIRKTCAFLSSIYLYPTKCALTGKDILTFIPPHKGLVVYDIDAWMSEEWEPLDQGQDYDFSRPFFEQFAELLKRAPLPSLECIRSTMENSDFTNGVLNVKNCYLSFGVLDSQDILFSRTVLSSKDIVESIYVTQCELCVGCIQINNCYNLRYSENCNNCSDSTFLFDCKNCHHCYNCTNLVNKAYCWNNEQLTKEQFAQRSAALKLGSYPIVQEEREKFKALKAKAAVKYVHGINNEDSTGNHLNNTKNCHNCIFSSDAENCEWSIQLVHQTRNAFVCDGFGQNSQNLYYSAAVGENAYNIKFCVDCYGNTRDLEYCIFVGFGSMNCFGCVGLKKKQYCILNKQYSKDEYFSLLQKIKAHMLTTKEYGEFFPVSLSPMDYNRSEAQVFMPLNKNEAEKLGYTWKEESEAIFSPSYDIPDDINEVQDDILNMVLKCEVTGKKYKIIKQELATYRKLQLPIPRTSPLARLESIQSSITMEEAKMQLCTQCQQEILTVYDTNKVHVLCESCYQDTIRN